MHKRDVKRFDVPSPLSLVNTSFSSTQSFLPPFLCVNASPSFFFFFFERERERGKKGKGETSCSFRYRWRGQGKETLKRSEHANVEEVDLCTINQVPGFWIEFIKKRGGLCIEFRTIISDGCKLTPFETLGNGFLRFSSAPNYSKIKYFEFYRQLKRIDLVFEMWNFTCTLFNPPIVIVILSPQLRLIFIENCRQPARKRPPV